MNVGVRDRSREILRVELAEAAAEFCVEHGFAELTVEQIAHGIGVSRATFFRYFTSKEDAVVSAFRGSAGALAERVAAIPLAPGSTAWSLVRAAIEPMIRFSRDRGEALRGRIRMIDSVPALKGRLAWERRSEQAAVAEALTTRTGDERAAKAIAAATLGAIDLAWQEWALTEGTDLADLIDVYFDALASAAAVPAVR
jgi:AcrR family transcriptional regulator